MTFTSFIIDYTFTASIHILYVSLKTSNYFEDCGNEAGDKSVEESCNKHQLFLV